MSLPLPALLLAVVCLCAVAPRALAERTLSYAWDRDVLYKAGDDLSEYERERCRLDVYYPEGAADAPVVVWFHAGGLRMGNKYVSGELREQGVVVVACNYRLSPNVEAPAYIEDTAAAVAWVFENIEEYGGSTDRIILAGASAGGYLVSMVTLDKRYLAAHNIDADRIAGVASIGGQMINHVAVREEAGIERTRTVVDELAPLYHVRRDAPPMLLATGDRDLELLGRYEENAFFWRMMKEVGHEDIVLHELDGFDHAGLEKPAHGLLLKFIDRFRPDAEGDDSGAGGAR